MDELTAELAMDRVKRGLEQVIPLLGELYDERPDERLLVSINALGLCIDILDGKR